MQKGVTASLGADFPGEGVRTSSKGGGRGVEEGRRRRGGSGGGRAKIGIAADGRGGQQPHGTQHQGRGKGLPSLKVGARPRIEQSYLPGGGGADKVGQTAERGVNGSTNAFCIKKGKPQQVKLAEGPLPRGVQIQESGEGGQRNGGRGAVDPRGSE